MGSRWSCAATGQTQPLDAGAVARCILESLALKHAQTVQVLGAATGVVPVEIHIVGGGARNALLCRFTADEATLSCRAASRIDLARRTASK